MITPSFALTATERVLPRMALDFTTATLDPRVTFTRSGNTATVTNSSGVIAAINANLPRFDFNPTTLICKGLLIEEARTNLLLNSLINGTSLSTQLVTTTAVAHTLSFYGTGQIVLTGTSSATVVGTGAYPTRTTLTFTPTVGVLTLTVTGTVQYAQLEAGAFVTSFIPTDGTTKTRNADIAVMTGTNFSDWYNQTQGAFAVQVIVSQIGKSGRIVAIDAGSTGNKTQIGVDTTNQVFIAANVGGGFNGNTYTLNTVTANVVFNVCAAYSTSLSEPISLNAGAVQSSNFSVATTMIQIYLGSQIGPSSFLNGCLSKINYWPQRLIDAEIQAFSK